MCIPMSHKYSSRGLVMYTARSYPNTKWKNKGEVGCSLMRQSLLDNVILEHRYIMSHTNVQIVAHTHQKTLDVAITGKHCTFSDNKLRALHLVGNTQKVETGAIWSIPCYRVLISSLTQRAHVDEKNIRVRSIRHEGTTCCVLLSSCR